MCPDSARLRAAPVGSVKKIVASYPHSGKESLTLFSPASQLFHNFLPVVKPSAYLMYFEREGGVVPHIV